MSQKDKNEKPGRSVVPPSNETPRRSTFLRLSRYAVDFWPLLTALGVCIVGSALLDLARPWIIGFQLLDLVVRNRALDRLPHVILLLTGAFIGQQIFDFGSDVLQELANQKLVNRVRCDLYAHTMALPVDCSSTASHAVMVDCICAW